MMIPRRRERGGVSGYFDGMDSNSTVHTAAASIVVVVVVGSRPNCWAAMQEQGVGGTAGRKEARMGWSNDDVFTVLFFCKARQGKDGPRCSRVSL
jgi:hypothetical protein